jgi:hypothetical protein
MAVAKKMRINTAEYTKTEKERMDKKNGLLFSGIR